LTKPSVILTCSLSASDNLLWVVEDGCVTMVLVSPKFAAKEHILIAFKNVRPPSIPPFTSKATTFPPNFICFLATSYCGCDFKNGYFTQLTFEWLSKKSATFNAFSQCLSTLTASVSKLFDNIQALKGDNAGPVFLENE